MDLRALTDSVKRTLVVCASALMLSTSAHGTIRAVAIVTTLAAITTAIVLAGRDQR